MPAQSEQQRKFFYAVKKYKSKKGKKSKVSKKIKDAANSMTMKQINDFLKPAKKKLPEKKASLEVISDLVKLANHLDALGLTSESDLLDGILAELLD
jgi:transposase